MRRHIVDQDKFARRHGLAFLKATFSFVIGLVVVAMTVWLATQLVDSGVLTAPDYLKDK